MNTKKPISRRLMRNSIRRGECLVWTGARNNCGYGLIKVDGKLRLAHRVAYEQYHGAIPAGMIVLHACDNRPCIEPAHLLADTSSANTRDMDNKKRGNRVSGSKHHKARLCEADAAEIRRRYVPYDRANGSNALAHAFSVSQSTVKAIIQGTTWKSA